jgi:hypothetical protein
MPASALSIPDFRTPSRRVANRRKRAKTPSSHGLRIVAANLTPSIAKFAVVPGARREWIAYCRAFADAGVPFAGAAR